jgi:hypothetical protein
MRIMAPRLVQRLHALQARIRRKRDLAFDTRGFVSLGPVLGLAGLVLGVVVSVMLLAALAPIYFPAVKNITSEFAEADTGSALANTILGIVAIIIPLALTFGFAYLVFAASGKLKKNTGGGV